MSAIHRYVSGTRRRFVNENFDLDLTYVTERIIVMGFPAVGVEAFYRNPRKKVLKFLTETHPNRYLVFNLCDEEKHQYDPKIFAHEKSEGSICVPFEDHSVPRLQQIAYFVFKAVEWLDADESNVVVTHCKAGKGRSGLMTCALLIAYGLSADSALALFAEKRSVKNEGVTIKSQETWVRMFANFLPAFSEFAGPKRQVQAMLELTSKHLPKKRKLVKVVVEKLPKGKKFFIRVERRGVADDRDPNKNKGLTSELNTIELNIPNLVVIVKQDFFVQEDFAVFLTVDRALEIRAWFCLDLPERNSDGQLELTNSEVDVPPDVVRADFKISLTLVFT